MTADDELPLWAGGVKRPADPIKIITLQQPWASAVITGVPCSQATDYKDVENRTWQTPWRGRLYIHAGMETDRAAPMWAWPAGGGDGASLPHGVVLGYVTLVTCTRGWHQSRWADHGAWHWWLRDPVSFQVPVKARGKLGLWSPRLETPNGEPDQEGIALARALQTAVTAARRQQQPGITT